MGHASHVLHMIFIIVFFLISFSCTTHILISNVQVDGNKDQKNAQILEKFRFLLQLRKSFTFEEPRNGELSAYISSPSPSPSPSPAPAPSPAVRFHHRRAHPPLHHHHHPLPQPQEIHKKEQGEKAARVLTAVLASFGVTFAFCAIGLFFVCLKLKKQKRKQKTRIISRFISSSQTSVKKVSSDPGPDLFYLDSLESALEPEKLSSLKLNNTLVCSASDEREEMNNKLLMTNSDCDERGGCCSNSFGEITTVPEISKQCDDRASNSSCGERIIPEEIHAFEEKTVPEETQSSDDESFHSFCDSYSSSSQMRLSNASACSSLAQISEILSKDEENAPPPEILSQSPPSSAAPPPPPPPPPPPARSSPRFPNPSSDKMKSHFLNPPKLQDSPQTIPETRPNPPAGVPPPPPCPPPLPKGQMRPLNIPPPPPNSGITQQIPLGKDGSPLTKLKPLHWDKVRAAPNRSTVWDKLRSSSFEFDEEMIESLFSYNLQNTTKIDEVKSKTPSPGKHVLEPKRLQNITILSKGLNVTAEQVCGALIRGDGLSLQDLEALSKMVPTKEEEAKLENYKGDVFELGSAEKLVKAMLKIPFAFARVEALLYRETFQDEVLHLTKSFSMLEEACTELRSSRLFLKLLEAVLKTGNRMNVGTVRGGAKAFKLDALLKLSDVKGTDGKTTLLHFVVQEIIRSEGIRVSESIMGKIHQKSSSSNSNSNTTQDKEEHYRKMGLDLVSGLSSELCNAKKTATIDLDVLATSVATLSEGLHKLKNLVEKEMMLVHDEKKGTFVDSLRCFVRHAETKLKEVRDEENRVLMHVREITEYFHGDVGKDEANPLRIFVIVRDFLSMLDNVCKELRSSKAPRSHNPLAPFR